MSRFLPGSANLVAIALLTVLSFAGPALAQDGPAAKVAIAPPSGPSESDVTIRASGLPANTAIIVMGGQTQGAMQPIATESSDEGGSLQFIASVPGEAEYDQDYHFALVVEGRTVGAASFRVETRTPPEKVN